MHRAWLGIVTLMVMGLAGCRSVESCAVPGAMPVAACPERNPASLPIIEPQGIETGLGNRPTIDLANNPLAVALKPGEGPYRSLTEAEVRTMAREASHGARRVEMENQIPAGQTESRRHRKRDCDDGPNAVELFLRQARDLAAAGDRAKAAGDAATTFYQLAEAEGRAELLRTGIAAFDGMRAEMAKPTLQGTRVIPPNEAVLAQLDQQRGQLLDSATLLLFQIKKLNIDLKQQTGLAGHTTDRLYPTGDFAIDPSPLDVPSLVRTAMENRQDLLLLRLAYYELNEDTLPAVRDQLRHVIGLMTPPQAFARPRLWLATAGERFGHGKAADPALVQELAVRRNQLFDLICEKEREAADQVRTAAVFQDAAGSLVASTNARAEALKKQVEALRAKKSPPAAEVPVLLEWLKARGEVITAVMNWHQARVKLQAAQGK
jgi:hypothetical protein